MPRLPRSVTFDNAACEVDYNKAVKKLAQALPILAAIAKRLEARDETVSYPSVTTLEGVKPAISPIVEVERDAI